MSSQSSEGKIAHKDPNALLSVLIHSRNKTYYDGFAQSVTSYNAKGIFDVLPEHANFISLIYKKIVVIDDQGSERGFDIDNGVLKVYQDKVDIYLEIV